MLLYLLRTSSRYLFHVRLSYLRADLGGHRPNHPVGRTYQNRYLDRPVTAGGSNSAMRIHQGEIDVDRHMRSMRFPVRRPVSI